MVPISENRPGDAAGGFLFWGGSWYRAICSWNAAAGVCGVLLVDLDSGKLCDDFGIILFFQWDLGSQGSQRVVFGSQSFPLDFTAAGFCVFVRREDRA